MADDDHSEFVRLFNTETFSKAIALLGSTEPQAIAQHIQTRLLSLSKGALGLYFAKNIPVWRAFLGVEFDFSSVDILSALKAILNAIKLPGEASMIDRLLNAFGEFYFSQTPANGPFTNAESVYVLCFCLIMLSTDAHSPRVQQKMTSDQFIRSCRGLDDGKDFEEGFLLTLYTAIQQTPLV